MATDFSNSPTGGGFEAGGYFYVTTPNSTYGVLPSELLIGGHQEFITLDDRDAIPIKADGAPDMITPDGLGSGRRRIGMIVVVVDPNGDSSVEPKHYMLLPYGYFGNGGTKGLVDWNLLSTADKLKLLDPTVNTSYIDDSFNTVEVIGSGNPDDCWFELVHPIELPSGGSAGQVLTKIDNLDYNVQWSDSQGGAQGAQGAQGAEGAQGAQGSIGDQGAQGAEGPQGVPGDLGPTGAQGSIGDQGAQGAEGPQGVPGDLGPIGAQGSIGDQGAQGAEGPQGVPGDLGPKGAQGIEGAQGTVGPTGAQGIEGAQGAAGAQGSQGDIGNAGAQGAQGAQGPGGDQAYITQIPDGTAMAENHGGISAGTLAEEIGAGQYTLSEMFDQILFPAICPTVSSQPNITLSDNVGPLEIIGDTINVTFTAGATLGQLSDGTTYAGDVTAATLTGSGPTNESLTVTPPTGIADYTLNGYVVALGTQSWTLTGTFNQGVMPIDNFGEDCPDVQYPGGSDSASVNFEGVYPIYSGNSTLYQGSASDTWTSASVNTTYWTQLNLFSFNDAYFQWNQEYDEGGVGTDIVRHRFVIPATLTVTDIQQFSTASSSYGSIGTSGFTQTNVTLDVFGNSVNYVVWEKNVSPGGSAQYRVYFS